jgi:hypothetical protein
MGEIHVKLVLLSCCTAHTVCRAQLYAIAYSPPLVSLDQDAFIDSFQSGSSSVSFPSPIATRVSQVFAFEFLVGASGGTAMFPFVNKSANLSCPGLLWNDAFFAHLAVVPGTITVNPGLYYLQMVTFLTASSALPFPAAGGSTLPSSYFIRFID